MTDISSLYGLVLMGVLTAGVIGLQGLSKALGPKPTLLVEDPRLGVLTFAPDVEAWRVTVPSSRGPLRFQISGTALPDEQLLGHAADLAAQANSFMDRVRAFLESEAHTQTQWADEIRALELDEVCLLWPKRPNDGMLYFTGAQADLRLWRCDYVNRTPEGLAFDS